MSELLYTGSHNEKKDAKETSRYKWMLIVTELLNIAVNYFDTKKSAHYSRVLSEIELDVSGTQCTRWILHFPNRFYSQLMYSLTRE